MGDKNQELLDESSNLSLHDLDNNDVARMVVLLRAAYDILTRCDNSPVVVDPAGVLVQYDGTTCDGYCLRDEIAEVLGMDGTETPIELKEEK